MIETLEQLTVAQFIELVCGNINVLAEKNEKISEEKATGIIHNIAFEYKQIADPAGAKSYISKAEELVKAKIEVALFSICNNLVRMNEYGRARDVINEYAIKATSMDDRRIAMEIKSRMERAEKTISRIEDENNRDRESLNIRRMFDEQTAALMAYFRFQIDITSMKATVYAHLIARHNREIKAKIAAVKKR